MIYSLDTLQFPLKHLTHCAAAGAYSDRGIDYVTLTSGHVLGITDKSIILYDSLEDLQNGECNTDTPCISIPKNYKTEAIDTMTHLLLNPEHCEWNMESSYLYDMLCREVPHNSKLLDIVTEWFLKVIMLVHAQSDTGIDEAVNYTQLTIKAIEEL